MRLIGIFSDNVDRRETIASSLRRGGFGVVFVSAEAAGAGPTAENDLLLIDVTAEIARKDIVAKAKAVGWRIILAFSAAITLKTDHLTGVEDFVVEPYSETELWGRIGRLTIATDETPGTITVDGLVIHPETYEVAIDGRQISLTFKEYELLKFLAGHPDRVWDRQALLNKIWDYDYFGGTRTVDVHVRRLRAKLGARYGGYIQTVRQVGYRWGRL